MSQWPLVPDLVLSSRANRWMPVRSLARVARDAGTRGVDLDLGARPLPFNLVDRTKLDTDLAKSVDSIWLPAPRRSSWGGPRPDHVVAEWVELSRRLAVRRLILDRRLALAPMGDRDKRPLLLRLQDGVGPETRITLAIRSSELEGTRAHLAKMSGIRRTAEEWGFDLAIDLLGQPDPRWEAEAALQRVLPRLVLVRIGSVAQPRPSSHRHRLMSRSLAYLLDQSFPGTLSLVPHLGWAGWLRTAALEQQTGNEAAAVIGRHQRIFASPVGVERLPTRP